MAEASKPLKLGQERSWGETTCHYGLERRECNRAATRHFFWLPSEGVSNACDEHAELIHARDTSATPYDEHTFGPNCGMPGAHWRFGYPDEDEGYCFFPAPDDLSALVVEPVPARQGVNA